MSITSLPSKTFLIGEYAVLNKGCGIVINTHPRFKFKDKKIFDDPHNQKGGFGSSSAKWIFRKKIYKDKLDPSRIISKFVNDTWNGKGVKPSGVDVLSQLFGGVFLINLSSMNYRVLDWKFYDFFIVSSGVKIETYKHLSQVHDLSKFNMLTKISKKAYDLYSNNDKGFFKTLKEFDLELKRLNLCLTETQNLSDKLMLLDGVLYARGCGAMGADTIIVFVGGKKGQSVCTEIKKMNLEIVATQADISYGIKHEI